MLAFYGFLFACQEKARKEQYVISLTNSKTKKILIGLLNQNQSPIAVITAGTSMVGNQQQAGQIVYCNAQFEKMLQERLGLSNVPQNIFRLTKDDEESSKKLRQIMATAL